MGMKRSNVFTIGVEHMRGFVKDVRRLRQRKRYRRRDVRFANKIEREAQYAAAVQLRTQEILEES